MSSVPENNRGTSSERASHDSHNILPEFHFTKPISAETLQTIREWSRHVQQSVSNEPDGVPFMVVTPLGLPRKQDIAQWLLAHGYNVLQRTVIPDWAAASTLLYPRTDDDERLTVALGFHALWSSVCANLEAERWDLASAEDVQRLSVEKAILRQQCGSLRFRVIMPTVTFHARLQALHVPDPDRYPLESNILKAACNESETPSVLSLLTSHPG